MRRSLPLVVALACIAACAPQKPQDSTEYFGNAEAYFREGAYTLAIDNYREMIDQYPFGPETEEAELRIAHAHYLNESYIEAIAAFTDFQRRHPTSPFLPFVGYELGMAYKNQMGTIDRDQSAARNADLYFSAVVAQYPESPYAELARGEIAECRQSLAEHEMYVAQFYARKGNYPAVENRALEVVSAYPQTPAADEALFTLGRLYEESDDARRASLAYAALVQDHPLSSRVDAARAALDRLAPEGGVGPSARQALIAATGYVPRSEQGAPVEVPGVGRDDRPFTPPPSGVILPGSEPPTGERGPSLPKEPAGLGDQGY